MSIRYSKKFAAWDPSQGTDSNKPAAQAKRPTTNPSRGSAGSSFEAITFTKSGSGTVQLSKGKRVSLDDVVNVAVNHFQVAYEAPAVAETVSLPCNSIHANSAGGNGAFPLYICRAGVFARIVAMLNGPLQWRDAIIEALVQMLNNDVIPCFSTIQSAGEELVAALTGSSGSICLSDGEKVAISQLVEDDLFAPIGLSSVEAKCLATSSCLATGIACLAASGAARLAGIVDGVSALSCEAFGASVEPFDAAIFENFRQHRGQMNSAANLRSFLEGSLRINNPSSKDQRAIGVFAALPQSTGPAVDAITAAAKTIEIELNSGDTIYNDSEACFDIAQCLVPIRSVVASMQSLSAASSQRTLAINANAIGVDSVSSECAFSELLRLGQLLSVELFTSLSAIGISSDSASAADDSKAAAVATEAAASNKKAPAVVGKGKEIDMDGLSEAQRAKVEAKRKEKAEKAAQKAAQKELKKAGASGTVSKPLGAGSEQLKQAVVALINAGELSAANVAQLVNPFNSSNSSIFASFIKILLSVNSSGKRKPKIAKGARDFTPEQMKIREQVFAAIRRIFKRHGGVEIDTPVFELKEILTGKYGEDSKLIYDLADQGGELLSLRYDLTVPFARFLAMNSVGNIKRYHVAKVYRRDQPQPARGRYREFYQCDFDIAGSYSPMIADAEVVTVAAEILSELPIGKFLIKLNHRKLLDAIFEICGVPTEKFRPICSAVDKLDKEPWSAVKQEMVEEKGLDEASADRIGEFVQLNGKPLELVAKFFENKQFGDHPAANEALKDLQLLFTYLEAMGSLDYVSFDLSLARGLDYYTGVIYEAVLTDGVTQFGSIAAGGRYDNLVGMFSQSNTQTPCVGVSIGIERVFGIMELKAKQSNTAQQSNIQVFIASVGPNLMLERMKVAKLLWKNNISAEYTHQENPRLKKQMEDVLERGIPFMVVIGSDEVAKGTIKLKNMKEHTEIEIPLDTLVNVLVEQGCNIIPAGADTAFMETLKQISSSSAAGATA